MEYPDMEWKIDEDYSSSKQSNGKVNWIIDTGIWLGKKAVITCAVISSAPLVLPPLVVFSTLGFACSVPFGLVFASYAFTQKIMSTLLPAPESSSMSEYDEIEDDLVQEVDDQGDEAEGIDLVQEKDQGYEAEEVDLVQEVEEQGRVGLNLEVVLEPEVKEEVDDTPAAVKRGDILEQSVDRGENDVENREQEKQIGTTQQTVMSIELGGRNSILPAGAALLQEDVVYGKNGIEKYDKEYLEEEERLEELVEEVADTMKLNVDDSIELEGRDIFLAGGGDDEKYGFVEQSAENEIDEGMFPRNDLNEEAKNETQGGLLQAGTDYGGNMVEKHEEKSKELVDDSVQRGTKEDKGKYFLVEDVLPMEGIKVRNENLIVEDKNAEPVVKMRKVIVNVSGDKKTGGEGKEDVEEGKKSEKVVLVVKKVKEETVGDMYINNNEEQVRGATGLLKNIRDESNNALVLESPKLSDDTDENRRYTKTSVKSFTVIVKTDKEKADTSTSVNTEISTKIICRTFEEKLESEDNVEPKNTLINLNAAREIADECGLDLFDYTAGDHYSYNDLDISQENENMSRKADDVADFPVLPVSTKLPESRYLNLLPEADPVPSPSEELLSEEKVWEQVDALRAILGYSAPVHTRSIEEIKALYVFTGIEPPPSFDDTSDDLAELNQKLRFLKSVVGVK